MGHLHSFMCVMQQCNGAKNHGNPESTQKNACNLLHMNHISLRPSLYVVPSILVLVPLVIQFLVNLVKYSDKHRTVAHLLSHCFSEDESNEDNVLMSDMMIHFLQMMTMMKKITRHWRKTKKCLCLLLLHIAC